MRTRRNELAFGVSRGSQLILAVFVIVLCGCERRPESSDQVGSVHDPLTPVTTEIAWETQWEGALERAQRQDRPLMVVFFAEWCLWCSVMDNTTFADRGVVSFVNERVVGLRVDADAGGRELAAEHQVDGLPTILVLTAGGSETGRILGYRAAADFITALTPLVGTLD